MTDDPPTATGGPAGDPLAGLDDVERAALTYLTELVDLERGGERTTLVIGPFAAFTLIGLLQLTTRHPGLSADQKQIARGLGRQLEPLFAGTPGEELLRRGGHPEWDVDDDGRR